MPTQPTNDAVPSESPRDLKFNAGKNDEFVNSPDRQYFDRFESPHYTVEGLRWLAQQSIAMFGYIPVDSFQMGASITLPNQILRDASSGEYYRWDGALPKMVPGGSTPSTTGGVGIGKWLSVGAGVVGSYAEGAGDALVAVKQPFSSAVGTTQHEFNSRQLYFADWGAKGDGVTDDSAAIQRACNEAPSGSTISFGNGNYLFSNITL